MDTLFLRSIEQRISTNHFDPARAIPDDVVRELVRLATTAPTAYNLQNWRFIAVRDRAAKARLRALAWNQPKVSDASVTFIVCGTRPTGGMLADRLAPSVSAGIMPAEMADAWVQSVRQSFEDQPARQHDEAIRSATFGAATLILAAQAMGFASSPMTGFDAEAVHAAFGLAADEFPVLLVPVGHAADGNWPRKPRRAVSQVLELA